MILTLVSLVLAVLCYTVSQLAQHGKLQRESKVDGFWGKHSHRRKYKGNNSTLGERWPTSTNLTIFLTDGYHLMQWFMFNFLSLSITFALGFDWYLLAGVWGGIHLIHWAAYKFLKH